MEKVLIYHGDDGLWIAECPSLPGCTSHGKTKEEAEENIREAIDAYYAALDEEDTAIPEERVDSLETVA